MSKNRFQVAGIRRRVAAVTASIAIAATAIVSPSVAQAQALPDLGQSSSNITSGVQDTLNNINQQTRDQAWVARVQLNSQISAVLPQAQAAEISRVVDQAVDAAFPGLIAERTAPPAAAVEAPAAVAPAPAAEARIDTGNCPADAAACVDLAGGRSWLQENGKISYGPVSSIGGKPGEETPRGTFYVTRKVKDEVSREFNNAPMPYSTYFTNNGHAFHADSVNVASAGCVHLNYDDAAYFFNHLSVGDKVVVY